MKAATLREISRPRTPVDRLRARMTTLAATGMGVALLMATSIAAFRSTQPPGAIPGQTGAEGQRLVQPMALDWGLAPFLVEEDLRSGVVLAAILMIVPFAALALQALRVGGLTLDRQAALLALAGATPDDLRRLRVIRGGTAFGLGGLLAGPVYLVGWVLLGVALPQGWRLLPVPQAWLPLAWLAAAGLLTLAGAVLGARSKTRHADPLTQRQAADLPPPRLVAWLSGLGALAVLLFAIRARSATDSSMATAAVLLLEALLLLVCVRTVVARRATHNDLDTTRGTSSRPGTGSSWSRRLVGSRGSQNSAVRVLAAAQRRSNPRAAGAVGGVLFVCGLSFGVETALIASVVGQSSGADTAFYVGGALLAAAVGVTGAFVALLALALSLTDHLLSARRSVASTVALGTERRTLLAVQASALSATALPATAVGILLAGLLYALLATTRSLPTLAITVGSIAAVALLSGMLVGLACRLIAQLLAGRLKAACSLDNLRTP